jgi:hypothetical protein
MYTTCPSQPIIQSSRDHQEEMGWGIIYLVCFGVLACIVGASFRGCKGVALPGVSLPSMRRGEGKEKKPGFTNLDNGDVQEGGDDAEEE